MRINFKLHLYLYLSLFLVFAGISTSLVPNSSYAAPAQKPLWKAGKYYGGFPSNDKYLTQGITFRISPDKVTMKDISIEFPADFHDELGNITPRSIHFSPTGIEPITLIRTSGVRSYYFAYLDEFDNNWNTELRITWNRNKQSFKIIINTQSDPVENTFYKASATLAKGAVRGKVSAS